MPQPRMSLLYPRVFAQKVKKEVTMVDAITNRMKLSLNPIKEEQNNIKHTVGNISLNIPFTVDSLVHPVWPK